MLGVIIKETMSGWIRFDKFSPHSSPTEKDIETSIQYPFQINIRAFCNKLRYPFCFDFTGKALFPGLPLPHALTENDTHPEVSGKMGISHSGVSYKFKLTLPNIGPLTFEGKKVYANGTLSWKKYRTSLITLPLTVKLNGKSIGSAELKYREPLYAFPFGVGLSSKLKAFHPYEKLTEEIKLLCPVFITNTHEITEPNLLESQIKSEIKTFSNFSIKLIRLELFIIKLISLLLFLRRPKKLNDKQKERFAKKFTKHQILHLFTIHIFSVLFSAVYNSKKYLNSQEQNIPIPPMNVEKEPWMRLNLTPDIQTGKEEIEVDVVVVGSGAGGGAFAYEMASRGYAVAIIEEGHYYKRPEMSGKHNEMLSKLYKNKGQTPTISNAPIWLPTGKCVGGTTTINSGTAIRLPNEIMQRWEEEQGLHHLNLETYFPKVEQMLDVKPTPTQLQGGISNVLKNGTTDCSICIKALSRAETGCDGQSFCILGCPSGAKRSTDISYIPEAMKKNAYLFTHYKVSQILTDKNKAVGIKAHLPDYGSEFSITIKAKLVVLAAGTFGTPHLLYQSKLHKNLPQLGKNLTIHPAINLGALFDYKVRNKLFVPQSMGGFGHPRFALEGYTIPAAAVPVVFLLHGKELKKVMSNIQYFTNFAAMIKDPAKGKLLFHSKGVIPQYFIGSQLKNTLKEATKILSDIFFNAGAQSVYTPICGYEKLQSKNDITKLMNHNISAYRYYLSAYHPLGTCQMGSSPHNSVVNKNGEVWGMKNLVIADGSVIPGPLGVNPQVTIMSNALRIANNLENKLS